MSIHQASRFHPQPRHLGRLTPLAGAVVCLYVLFSAFLILCLAHPPDTHSHTGTDHHFDFACLWVQKAVSSHAPSAKVILATAETIACAVLPFLWILPQVRLAPATGRSPPRSPLD